MTGHLHRAALVLILFSLLMAGPATAKEACLKDIAVLNSRDHCLLFFRMDDCFNEEMKKAIDNGISTTFTFYVQLNEIRDLWWDKEIVYHKISHNIQFDNLKKVYMVRLSEKNDKVFYTEDFLEAKRLMSEIVGFGVTELSNLKKGSRYEVRMMAELDKIRLPFYLHYVLFFLSLWDFETDWYALEFEY